MKKLTVVIVSYNVKHYVQQCLLSLRRALADVDGEVYVVDNQSHDGTVEFLREHFPEVKVIASEHNLGFARANNIAIRQSESEYVLLLNPDTFVGEKTIRESLQFMDNHGQAGALGVRMLKADGTDALESRRGLPTPMVAFYKMSGLCARFPKHRRFGQYYMGYLSWDEAARIEVISGAYCLLRRKALEKVGLLDEDFFMYGEDIDLSYRLLKGGFENWYLPSKILHYKGESTQKSSFRYVHVFYKAMLIFFRKHYSGMTVLLSLPIKITIFGKAFATLVRIQAEKLRRSLGLVETKRAALPLYIVLGSRSSLDACRKLAQSKGLDAQFIEADSRTRPEGHQGVEMPENRHVYVVYDTDAFRFSDILERFSSNSRHGVTIGTYLPQQNTIITADEIIK
ncbi:MAG: glycosyltransferase family 2 protein [Prevotella sp.]|nr:glycosyltransferase family 2 protein [Prevotella sp.]